MASHVCSHPATSPASSPSTHAVNMKHSCEDFIERLFSVRHFVVESWEETKDAGLPGFVPFKFAFPSSISDHLEHFILAWIITISRTGGDDVFTFGWSWRSFEDKIEQYHEGKINSSSIKFKKHATVLESLKHISALKTARKPDSDVFHNRNDYVTRLDCLFDHGESIHLDLIQAGHYIWIQPTWKEYVFTNYTVSTYIQAFMGILEIITSQPGSLIRDLYLPNHADLDQIWKLNGVLAENIDVCMHTLVSRMARLTPAAMAIDAWDGCFTYHQVDSLSNRLAYEIVLRGVAPGTMVLVCFEKSRWTSIAILGIMKAGAAFVMMDQSQPIGRLQTIADQVSSMLIITSRNCFSIGSRIMPANRVLSIGPDHFDDEQAIFHDTLALPEVSPSSLCYVVFTSGSTGQPKGVMINHNTYTSSVFPRSEAVGYDENSRVLDFASYAFDVSIDSMLCTLMRGGCLCIPSDSDRTNDLAGVIKNMKINMANLTPSVARILDIETIGSLRSLGLGGEAISPSDVALWGSTTRIAIGYGPSETTVGCTMLASADWGKKKYVSIGFGTGGALWIVNPDDHNELMPIGAVGELLVEGPIVGAGYLNDHEKTAKAFIHDPTWLTDGHGTYPGRSGRLYKTGDLVVYDPDGRGSLVFVGRKDRQVKIRGQRVELGEIEHHLRKDLPANTVSVVEVIKPPSRPASSVLVAFVSESTQNEHHAGQDESKLLRAVEASNSLQKCLVALERSLPLVLPRYMVPSVFICTSYIPHLVSGKVDRKLLQRLGTEAVQESDPRDHQSLNSTMIDSEALGVLQQAWATVLRVEPGMVRLKSNFIALGGDSILAMKLVANLRTEGFSISVGTILDTPVLEDMVALLEPENASTMTETLPFALVEGISASGAQLEASELLAVPSSIIEDIYPCTPVQETLMAMSVKSENLFVAQRVFDINTPDSVPLFKTAWEQTASDSPLLRTRILQLDSGNLVQIVLRETIEWQYGTRLTEFLEADAQIPIGLGDKLSRYAIVVDVETGLTHMIWTAHHCVYDGWSTDLTLDRVIQTFLGRSRPPSLLMKDFVKYVKSCNRQISKAYWSTNLLGAATVQFPVVPSRDYLPAPSHVMHRRITLVRSEHAIVPPATLIRASLAFLFSEYLGSNDIIFGETFTGRSVALPGAEVLEGPMITTAPVRIHVDQSVSIKEYLHAIHKQAIERIPHEHMGLNHIRRLSDDAQRACEIKTGLVIHPYATEAKKGEFIPNTGIYLRESLGAAQEALKFNSYALMIVCALSSDGFDVHASFDDKVASVELINTMLYQLQQVIQLFCDDDIKLRDIKCLINEGESPKSVENDKTASSKELNSRKVTTSGHDQDQSIGSQVSDISSNALVSGASPITGRDNSKLDLGDILSSTPTATKELQLQAIWSRLLNINKDDIMADKSFFRLGGDSISAMRLVSLAKKEGLLLSVADVFRHNRLRDMAATAVEFVPSSLATEQKYEPFSLLPGSLKDLIKPLLADPSWSIQDAYPATDMQSHDVLATITSPRTSVQYNLFYFDHPLDLTRFSRACRALVRQYDILRTVFVEIDKKLWQVVLQEESVQPLIEHHNTSAVLEKFVDCLCNTDITQQIPLGSLFIKFMIVKGLQGRWCFAFKISHSLYDGISLPVLLRQFEQTYQGQALVKSVPFSIFVDQSMAMNEDDRSYWRQRLNGSSPTKIIPRPFLAQSTTAVRITRAVAVDVQSASATAATLLTAAWSIFLARYLDSHDLVFGSVKSGRGINLPNIDSLVGPCYQYVPVRVQLARDWTVVDLLQYLQTRFVDDLPHETIGLATIVKECTDWPVGTSIDSIVHHVDIEHFDSMPFADTTCRVEISNPDGDSVSPMKVISYYNKNDCFEVGLIGSSAWKDFLQETVAILAQILEILVSKPNILVSEVHLSTTSW